MPRALFSEAPDSLFESLGLQDGIPSAVCAFLVKAEGKNILFDAADGAPDSRLMNVLDSCGVALQLEYPQYCARFDADHEHSVNTRKKIVQMGKDNGLTLYGMHFPAPYYIK